jgi:hypothetical protein
LYKKGRLCCQILNFVFWCVFEEITRGRGRGGGGGEGGGRRRRRDFEGGKRKKKEEKRGER